MNFFRWVLPFFLLQLAFLCDAQTAEPSDVSAKPGAAPEPWPTLERYQGTLTRAEFENRLHQLFDPFGGLTSYLAIQNENVTVFESPGILPTPELKLSFADAPEHKRVIGHDYRSPAEFRAMKKDPVKPLTGLRVAIDPGHIGGKWGEIENRSIYYKGYGLIQEGDMNIITARIIKAELEKLGAEVFLSREDLEPVTPLRPADMEAEARSILSGQDIHSSIPKSRVVKTISATDDRLKELENFLFYRRYEILARGEKIRGFHPDITIVLYINATPRSMRHELTDSNRNIFFVEGAYTKKELSDPHKRFRLFYKLLEDVVPLETEVARAISDEFQKTTKLPAVLYGDSSTTRLVIPDYFYVVARNLVANREYDGPVVVTEPYFMNNRLTARRLLKGDYDGTWTFEGKPYGSIFREYAGSVVRGLLAAYSGAEAAAPAAPPDSSAAH